MTDFVYNRAKRAFLTAALNFTTADMRVALVMTNTTCHTQKTAQTFADFTTIDEADGSGYTSPGVALTGETVVNDDANDRVYFDANDAAWAGYGAGTRQVKGAVLYAFSTNLNASQPVAWFDSGGFPFQGNGSPVTITWNSAGIVQVN